MQQTYQDGLVMMILLLFVGQQSGAQLSLPYLPNTVNASIAGLNTACDGR